MIESPAQPRHAAELALIAGFILLLLLEAIFLPPAPPRRARVAGWWHTAAEAVPPGPSPAP
jgi:hypothetical protein